jgi:Protein of unknown function (DUF1565)
LLMAANCGGEVTTPEPPNVRISPQALSVVVGSPALTFTATVARSSASVIWSLKGEGSLSSTKGASVDYTAPASVAADTTAEITATLEGTTVSDKAVVTIQSTATAPGTGVITVTIAGLSSANAAVTVTGPNRFNQKPTTTKTFTDLPPGKYDITAQEVLSGADKYQPDKTAQSLDLKAGETLEAKVNYSVFLVTLYVNPTTGADTNSGAKDKPFKTITKALDKAVAGQTVFLQAGTYSASSGEVFPLGMKSSVTLEGETNSVITSAVTNTYCLILEDVRDVQLLKLKFECAAGVVVQNATNISLEQISSTAKEFGFGFDIYHSNVVINASQFYNGYRGLGVMGSSQVTLTNSELYGNQFGISVENTAQLTADNSSFTENSGSGIFVRDSASVILKNSHADNNGSAASSASGLTINSTGDGTVTVDNSTFSNNSSDGINLHSGFAGANYFEVTITNSTFANNPYGLTIGDVEGAIELSKNLFVSNTVYQISHRRPDKPPARYVYALETTIEDSMGVSKQLAGLETGPDKDPNIWEITNANNYICFDASCVP